MGLEPTSERGSPPVFETGPSSGRMTSVNDGNTTQSAQSDSNRRSRASGARGFPGFPIRRVNERPAGVEPALPPWQSGRQPLHHGRLAENRIVKDRQPSRVVRAVRRAPVAAGFVSGVGGLRTLTRLIKSQKCCRYTTTPDRRGPGLCRRCRIMSRSVRSVSVARGGVEPPPAPYQSAMLPLQHRA